MKAAIYIRVSTDAQFEEGYSVDAQKEQLTAYCVSKGIKKYDYYIDGGWSGSNIERPEMERLMTDVKEGKISHVIVYKLDRLSRSQKDTLYLIEDVFMPNNVDFVSLTESLDTSSPVGRTMIGVLAAFSQLERETIRMRTRMGMNERVKEGYWMGGGRIPYGYDYDKTQGILVPNKDAEKVRKIYDLYIQGYSPQNIANMLGLKYDKLATQILKRKSNYGIIEYNGVEYHSKDVRMPDAQFNAGVDIIKYVQSKVPTAKFIGGHREFMSTACPGDYFPAEEMKTLKKRGNQTKEITDVNGIVAEYVNRGIITDKSLWLKKLDEDTNSYWLARKTLQYMRTNSNI